MAAPITLEQIIAELSVKRPRQPWDTPMGGASPQGMHMMPGGQMMANSEMGSIADQPMAQAGKREELMKALAPIGALANPERGGQGSGLIRLLMGLMQ
jgi:hypothetical protein